MGGYLLFGGEAGGDQRREEGRRLRQVPALVEDEELAVFAWKREEG